MRKIYLYLLALSVLASVFAGCAAQNTPKEAVLRFIRAAGSGDVAALDNMFCFERLMIEKDGEAYLKMPQPKREEALAAFRKDLLKTVTVGMSRTFADFEPKIRNERISEGNAEVVVCGKKNETRLFSFYLSLENGAWKIYKITAS